MNKILCLYSGGADSTLAAYSAAKKAGTVYLITYRRFGLFSARRSMHNLLRLEKLFPEVRFVYKIVDFEKEYRQICYNNHLADLLNFGLITASICGLCKLAMHWKTINLCKEYAIDAVYDGAVRSDKVFPAQNEHIMLDELKKLYAEQNISYENPVYDLDVQKVLCEEKIMPSAKKIKATAEDKIQPLCSQQLLFGRFVNYYLNKYSFEEYEQKLKKYYYKKIDYLRERLRNA